MKHDELARAMNRVIRIDHSKSESEESVITLFKNGKLVQNQTLKNNSQNGEKVIDSQNHIR